ncbi:MAG: hypothetical protein JWM76_3744 [Pseudonocardiales bacterium]|nr:hypothetical protein [Pseudonocardiales bacterium]
MIAAVAVIAAGSATAVVTYLRVAGPSQVVSSYFDAVRSGDAPKALAYAQEVTGDRRFLTSEVLRVQQRIAAIGEVTIVSSTRTGEAATVSVSYPIGTGDRAKTARESVGLRLVARHWRIDSPAASVRIDVGSGRNRATLAGMALPTDAVWLFPGGAPITYDTPLLEQGVGSDRIQLSSTGTLRVVAKPTDAGRDQLVRDLRAAMAGCLEQAAAAPAACPLAHGIGRVVPGSLRGALTELTLSADPTLISSDADGLLQLDGSATVHGSWTTLDFNNLPVAASGDAIVAISARAYVSAPAAVAWVKQ